MGWWFSRRKPRGEQAGPTGLEDGEHRSPGFGALCTVLGARRNAAILDLGPSSTENLAFLAGFTNNVQVQDLFRSCGGSYESRAESFRFPDAASMPLPQDGPFDAILAWDLFHYFERRQLAAFLARLAALSHPGTRLLAIASATAPIPPTPIQFKIVGAGRLEYHLVTEMRLAAPELTPREVEKLMGRFQPERLFQLRNGLQEFLFTFEDEPVAPPAETDEA